MALINVPEGGVARAIHVQQILNWMRGNPSFSEPVSFTGITSSSAHALTVLNLDAAGKAFAARDSGNTMDLVSIRNTGVTIRPLTNGVSALRVRNVADTDNIFEVTDTGVNIGGVTAVTLTGSQTLTNKTLTSPNLAAPRITTYVDYAKQASGPGAPAAGTVRFYNLTSDEIPRYIGATGAVEKTLVDTDSAQNVQNKTVSSSIFTGPQVSNYIEYTQIATPAAPTATKVRVYSKTSTNLLHYITNTSGEKTIVDTDSVQTVSNKTLGSGTSLSGASLANPLITNYEDLTEGAASPGDPGAGKLRLWAKTDNNLYVVMPGGGVTVINTSSNTPATGTSLARAISLGGL